MKYISQGNPSCISLHFDDGTQGKPDFNETQNFVNTRFKAITTTYSFKSSTYHLRELTIDEEDKTPLNHII